jgi:UDP-glucose 4-epimerase
LQGAIAAFLGKACSGEEVCIWGDGEVVRDYLYVDDLLTFAVAAGTGKLTGAVNVGSGVGYTLNQIVSAVRDVTGARLPVKYAPARKYDVAEIVLDITRAQSEFGWHPTVDLTRGISSTWQAMRSL